MPQVKRRMEDLDLKSVTIDDAFWSPRQKINREVCIPHQYRQCERTGR
ncbi:MAG: hypothetical protein HQ546_10335, partial [Planctomycetes bacterium]|nr:hypothetical protein [Planctomycetota bacterium]